MNPLKKVRDTMRKLLLAFLFIVFQLPATTGFGLNSSLSNTSRRKSDRLEEIQKGLEDLRNRKEERETENRAPDAMESEKDSEKQGSIEKEDPAPEFELRTLTQLEAQEDSPLSTDWFESLTLYGTHLFDSISPQNALPQDVPPSYILGPGDKLSIHIWNQTQDEAFLTEIDASGKAPFPLAGEISLQGVSLGVLPAHLKNRLSSYYKDIHVSAQMTELRRFPVYLTGEVRNPGLHLVNALTTPLQLLLLKGGPTQKASLRKIAIKRDAETAGKLDLYAFLMQGEISGLSTLRPGDVVHVPLAERRAAIAGRVKRPAVYELHENTTALEAIELAGGFEADADRSLIQIIRYNQNGQAVVEDLTPWSQKREILHDGEILRVHPMRAVILNTITISGNVYAPGSYQWSSGITLGDLIKKAQGIKPETYRKVVEIIRELPTPANVMTQGDINLKSQFETINVSLEEELSTKGRKVTLKPKDKVRVYHLDEVQSPPAVEVNGEVSNPGNFDLRKDMRVRDILLKAQIKESAHLLSGEIARQSQNGIDILKFNVKMALEGHEDANLYLQNLDVISIHQDPRVANQGRIRLEGEVRFPGNYLFKTGDRLADLLKRAGGVSDQGWLPGARLLRKSLQARQLRLRDQFIAREKESVQNLKIQASQIDSENAAEKSANIEAIDEVGQTLDKLAKVEVKGRLALNFRDIQTIEEIENSETNIVLEDGDTFIIPTIPSDVTIAGQVYSPATVLWKNGFSAQDYIDLAGGFSDNAHTNRIFVLKADGSAMPIRGKRRSTLRYVSSVEGTQKDVLNQVSSIEPGDTIVVPLKLKLPRNRMRESLDSIYKMAVTVGALGNIF